MAESPISVRRVDYCLNGHLGTDVNDLVVNIHGAVDAIDDNHAELDYVHDCGRDDIAGNDSSIDR